MTSIFEQNGGTYTLGPDGIFYPNITIPEEEKQPLGKYGQMRFDYLRHERPIFFNTLLITGKLYAHLKEVDSAANGRMELMMNQLADQMQITEQLKAEDQMEWVRRMNTARNLAEETVLSELVLKE